MAEELIEDVFLIWCVRLCMASDTARVGACRPSSGTIYRAERTDLFQDDVLPSAAAAPHGTCFSLSRSKRLPSGTNEGDDEPQIFPIDACGGCGSQVSLADRPLES